MIHDLTEDQIREVAALYALGALPEAEAREFEKYLAAGGQPGQDELTAFSKVVGRIGIGAPPQAPPPQLRARLLAELDEEKQRGESAKEIGSVTVRHHEGQWKECGPGVFIKHLFTDKARGTMTALYKLLPGGRLPRHGHSGAEECLVVEGDFHANNEVYGPGDYRCALPGSIDADLYTEGGAVLLIIGPEHYEMLETPS